MEDARTADRLERGRALFNAGRFFEAHEVWEEAWLVEKGETRVLLQGLIQVTAGCHKAKQGNASGCARLLGSGLEKLEAVAAQFRIGAFARAMADAHARTLRWKAGDAPDAGPFPTLPPVVPTRAR